VRATACILIVLSASTAALADRPDDDAIDRAVAAAEGYLLETIGPDGACEGELPPDRMRFGGRTALCVLALLGGGPPEDERLRRAIDWLAQADLTGTWPVALRVRVLLKLDEEEYENLLSEDLDRLVQAGKTGAYGSALAPPGQNEPTDNFHTAEAAWAVYLAEGPSFRAARSYWEKQLAHWTTTQQDDGGWAYRVRPEVMTDKTCGSITAAAVSAMAAALDRLPRRSVLQCEAETEAKELSEGLDWLRRNFRIDADPGLGCSGQYRWLERLARLGRMQGRRRIAGRDWYAAGCQELLATQRPDGAWGYGDAVTRTARALLFLLAGRRPPGIAKLQYPGQWNPRPRDCAHLAAWLSETMKRPLRWQVVELDDLRPGWREAPIVYVSGTGRIALDESQQDKLRRYVLRGGLLVSEAACDDTDFTIGMFHLWRRLFPAWEIVQLDADHPVYRANFSLLNRPRKLWAVTNGVRLLAIHSAQELSRALQFGPQERHMPIFELLGNVYSCATDRGRARLDAAAWPEAEASAPRATIRLAKVAHSANPDPEPLALERLSGLMAERHGIALNVTGPLPPEQLDPNRHTVAWITGTEELALSDREVRAVEAYLAGGGRVILEAAGGSEQFASSARRLLSKLVPDGELRRLTIEQLNCGPEPIERVRYRPDFAAALGPARSIPRIKGLWWDGRLAAVFSPDDLTAALVGYPGYELCGYAPETAVSVATNLLCRLSGVDAP